MAKNKTNASFASAVLNSTTTEPMVQLTINGKKVSMKLSDFMAAQAAATAAPATPAPTVVKPAAIAPETPADYETAGKIAACFSAAKANVKAVAPWNGVKGKGSVGGRFSPEGIAAFKAGYNAKAKELGVPTRY
jgi:phosphate-selective porin